MVSLLVTMLFASALFVAIATMLGTLLPQAGRIADLLLNGPQQLETPTIPARGFRRSGRETGRLSPRPAPSPAAMRAAA